MQTKLVDIVKSFKISGEVENIEKFGSGHIAETYLISTTKDSYILQKINNYVFKDVDMLMENINKVTSYLLNKGIETIEIIRTKEDNLYLSKKGEFYRLYSYIKNTISYDICPDIDTFNKAGKAFGEFQYALIDFDAKSLFETIKDFHNTPKRFKDFTESLDNDLKSRKDTCKDDINYILSLQDKLSKIVDGINNKTIPLRVTHNDTKLNNILFDKDTLKVRAVVDLDTVMPGSLLYDFGDAIRSGAVIGKEDEKDLDNVHFSLDLFKSYLEGYLSVLKDTITKEEINLLPYSAFLITLECGMRFLGDYLDGDLYFSIDYPEHNLVRARTQLKVAKEIEDNLDKMSEIVKDIISK